MDVPPPIRSTLDAHSSLAHNNQAWPSTCCSVAPARYCHGRLLPNLLALSPALLHTPPGVCFVQLGPVHAARTACNAIEQAAMVNLHDLEHLASLIS